MKKFVFILAIATMFVAVNSIQAETILQKDNFTYKIKGDWQIQLRQDPGQDQDLDLEYDDLEIKNAISYDLGNGLSAFGELDFGFNSAADSSDTRDTDHIEEAYIGIKVSDFKFLIGKTDSAADEFGVEGAWETYEGGDDVFDVYGQVKGDDLIMVIGKIAKMVDIRAAYELQAESESSHKYGGHYDIYVAATFGGATIGGAYQHYEPDPSTSDEAIEIWGVMASYDFKFLKISADYGVAEADSDTTADGSFLNAVVKVPVGDVTLCAGYVINDPDSTTATESVNAWYGNVTYKFPSAKNVRLFAEIGDNDRENVDMGYLVGMQIVF